MKTPQQVSRTATKLALSNTREQLEELLKGVSQRIDFASGLELHAARRRYWTITQAIDLHRQAAA